MTSWWNVPIGLCCSKLSPLSSHIDKQVQIWCWKLQCSLVARLPVFVCLLFGGEELGYEATAVCMPTIYTTEHLLSTSCTSIFQLSFELKGLPSSNACCIFHPTESTDSSKEKVHGSFTTEVAVEFVKSQNEPPSHTPESDAPFDPNLQCEKCGRRYKEGQIQAYKKHTNECVGN